MEEFSASARVNQYETGKHMPDLATIESLCIVLNIPMAYLFCADDDLANFLLHYHHLPKAEFILKVLNS